jgi:hypothetical protein
MGQKKIDDNLLLEMLKQGKLQKEIAEHFGVTPVAICKRLQKLLPPPESILIKHDLTDQQKRFCIEKAKGKTNTQAVLSSYEVGSMQSAKVIGSNLMDKSNVRQAIDELMEIHGLSRSYRIQRLKQHVDNPIDANVSLKALDMSFKLADDYPSQKNETLTEPLHTFTQVNIESLLIKR